MGRRNAAGRHDFVMKGDMHMEGTSLKSKDTKIITAVTYVYLFLPFLIFIVGWIRIRFWVPVAATVIFCAWAAWQDTPAFWRPELNRDNAVKILFICAVLAVWVFYSGIGFKVFQNADHPWRNAIFETLVYESWPVYNRDINLDLYQWGTEITSLIYYIGFWMPASVVGKLAGIRAGYAFQMLWAFAGLVLVYYYMCARKRRLTVWPLLLLIFFSGLDTLGMYLIGSRLLETAADAHIEWWIGFYQFSSMTTQLFWVFNQALPAWLCTVFMMQQKNNRSLVFILASVMLNATFPFVGLLVFVAFWMVGRKYAFLKDAPTKERALHWLKSFIKDSCTVQNILGGGIVGMLTYLYLNTNVSAARIKSQSFLSVFESIDWPRYFIFILVEAGIYIILVYKSKKNAGTYYVMLLSLACIPLLRGGFWRFLHACVNPCAVYPHAVCTGCAGGFKKKA